MYDTRTIGRADEVPRDHAEGLAVGTHPGEELLVAGADELLPLVASYDEVGELLVSRLVGS